MSFLPEVTISTSPFRRRAPFPAIRAVRLATVYASRITTHTFHYSTENESVQHHNIHTNVVHGRSAYNNRSRRHKRLFAREFASRVASEFISILNRASKEFSIAMSAPADRIRH